jgi:hypothetical protein
MPPLRPAPLHHFLAVRRAHTLEKAVTGLPLAPVRLIRALHLKLLWISEARILCLIPYLVKRMSYFELLFCESAKAPMWNVGVFLDGLVGFLGFVWLRINSGFSPSAIDRP